MNESETIAEVMNELESKKLLSIHRMMQLTRSFEMKVAKLNIQKGVPETPHLCIGQEAVGVGSCYAIRKDDYVLPSLRGRSVFLAKGIEPKILMAGVLGKITGPAKGKWPAHHMGDLDKGILVGSLLIGSQIPIAVGAALAIKMKKKDQVCVCYFGDGASNRGDFHEGLNLAAIFDLPVIFLCENNLYAIDTPVERSMRIKDISVRAEAYGMPGRSIDGNDVLAVYTAVKDAADRARSGGGPTLIECKTYRLRPHTERLQEDRNKEELEAWWGRCPIKRYSGILKDNAMLSEETEQTILAEVEEEINEAVRFAEESEYPPNEELYEDIYSNGAIREGRLCMC